MGEGLIQIGIAAITGGGLTAILNYMRQTRKDAASERGKDKAAGDVLTLSIWTEITKEQRDWRDVLRKEISGLHDKLSSLQEENASLIRRVAELEGRNIDLQAENEDLETRVKELERELRLKHGEIIL